MLKQEENELISRVGPGTPMGSLMREYWLPGLISNELPTPDSDPVRVLLLGEQLIAFRDTNGSVGLVQNNCPHRGASLFFGRNEECGLRCVYHGWKFDTDGNCVDMPNEPAESDFKHKVKATAYPTRERGGVVWVYMGPRPAADLPPLPELEANMVPGAENNLRVNQIAANWLQILEGDIDTVHASFLHYGGQKLEDQPAGTFSEYQIRNRHAVLEVIDTDSGASYGAARPGPDGMTYWRIAHWLFPFYSMAPPGVLGLVKSNICRVPMDDGHTLNIFMNGGTRRAGQPAALPPRADGITLSQFGATLTNGTGWYDRFRLVQNEANDFLIDRDLQRRNEGSMGYTGIVGVPVQDAAMTTSMGPVLDRAGEHLGSTDMMVIRIRRRMLAAIKAHQDSGVVPPGVDDPQAYHLRPGGVLLPEGADWVESTRELRRAFVDHPELDPAINGPL